MFHRYPVTQAVETNGSLPDFLAELIRRGCTVHYVSMKSKIAQARQQSGLIIYELPFSIQRKSTYAKMVQSLFYYLASALYAVPMRLGGKSDLVYCDDSIPFLGLLLKILGGGHVVIRLGDLQTGYLIDTSGKSLQFRFVHRFEIAYWKLMDGVVPISNRFQEYVKRQGVREERIRTVPECVDSNHFKPRSGDSQLFPKSKEIRLMYHGVLEPQKGLDLPLSYFESCVSSGANVELVIIGDGSIRSRLEKRYSQLILSGHLAFLGWKDLNELPALINTADIGLASRRPGLANEFVLTAGMLQYLACGKPVIAPRFGTIEDAITTVKCGVLFAYDSKGDFSNALERLSTDAHLRNTMGENARKAAVGIYSNHVVAQELADAVLSL